VANQNELKEDRNGAAAEIWRVLAGGRRVISPHSGVPRLSPVHEWRLREVAYLADIKAECTPVGSNCSIDDCLIKDGRN